jgi:quercetin dioxygenase-like cupin family protein
VIHRIEKPWGHEILFAHTDRYAAKILCIRAGERLSLQYHRWKDETIYVLSGELELESDESGALATRTLPVGEAFHIPAGRRHRMIARTECCIAEASTPELDDVVRLEDAYGRADEARTKSADEARTKSSGEAHVNSAGEARVNETDEECRPADAVEGKVAR